MVDKRVLSFAAAMLLHPSFVTWANEPVLPATFAISEQHYPLLALERHRASVVQRIVGEWGDVSSALPGGRRLSKEQLTDALMGLRSDRLLAASLAGSFSTIEEVLAEGRAENRSSQRVAMKSLGDVDVDLVYTPLTPCRIVDTRNAVGALQVNEIRTEDGYNATSFAAQGGASSNCGIPNGVAALTLNIVAVQPSGLGHMTVWPANAAEPNASTINFNSTTVTIANGTIMPVDSANSNRFNVTPTAQVHLVVDVVGYFKSAASGNALEIKVNNQRAMRYEYNATSPNLIGGHPSNSVGAFAGQTIAGGGISGGSNVTAANFATIGGGGGNTASGGTSTVAGGGGNTASGNVSTVGGGSGNTASGNVSTVGGGSGNTASGFESTVGGGFDNHAVAQGSTVGGGQSNEAFGNFGTVAGGFGNAANGGYSFAVGNSAQAGEDGCFVFANWSSFPSSKPSCLGIPYIARFLLNHGIDVEFGAARSDGGGSKWFHIGDLFAGNAVLAWNGARLTDGGAWTNASGRSMKENFAPIDTRDVLRRVAMLPVTQWNYRTEPGVMRMGPVAEDFYASFALGTDDKSISTVDASGVALAAIQGLNQVVQEKDARIAALEKAVGELKRLVEALVTK